MARHNTKSSFSNKAVVEDVPTTLRFLPRVIDTTRCHEHGAPFGTHCHAFQSPETEKWHYGICNKRAKAAGMTGKIHPSSLDRQYNVTKRG